MRKIAIGIAAGFTVLFFIVLFCHEVFSKEPAVLKGPIHPSVSTDADLIVISTGFFACYIIQAFLQAYKIPTPYGGFLFMCFFFGGLLAYHNKHILMGVQVMHSNLHELVRLYTPIIVFYIAFTTDIPIFLKSLPQVIIIAIPICLLTAFIFALLMSIVLDHRSPIYLMMTSGILNTVIDPSSVISILRGQSSATKQIAVLLEGEAVLVFMLANWAYKIMVPHVQGFLPTWYHWVMVTLRTLGIGLLFGFPMGFLARFIIRKTYVDVITAYLFIMGAALFTYYLSDYFIGGCGSVSLIITGAILSMERTYLPKSMDNFFVNFWTFVVSLVDTIVLVRCAFQLALVVMPVTSWEHYPLMVVMYVCYYAVRFTMFFAFQPILKRVGYGMNMKTLMACVHGGLKSPYSLLLISHYRETIAPKGDKNLSLLYFYWVGFYLLSVMINGSSTNYVLDFLELRTVSMARKVNMDNCIKHVMSKRERKINVLKMSKFLGDANWPEVISFTNLKHPYQMTAGEAGEEYFLGYKTAYCERCQKDVVLEPTVKEMNEMFKEAKMRILKVRKQSYSRQFENGMMSKEGIRILSLAVEFALDSESKELKVEDLHKKFFHESCFKRFIKKSAKKIEEKKKKRGSMKPNTYWRRLCFNITINNNYFERIMLVISAMSFTLMIIDMYYQPSIFDSARRASANVGRALNIGELIFLLIFVIEMFMKILAHSHKSIFCNGILKYFKSFWNTTDVLVIIGMAASLIIKKVDFYTTMLESNNTKYLLDFLRLARSLRLLRVFEIYYADIIVCLDQQEDAEMALTYELGKSFTAGEAEILDMLPYLIDNVKIRSEMKQKIESDRLLIIKVMGMVQKERPWIAITVKTTQAIRTILNNMEEMLTYLRSAGWVDITDNESLSEIFKHLYRKVNDIKKVDPSPPKVIFKEVAWMANDDTIIEYLFENVSVKRFEPGDAVFSEGEVANGIYIVVTGLLVLKYKPDDTVLRNLYLYGQLPIVDYISSTQYQEEYTDYIVSGNCIGELSTLTERAYNCSIIAEAHTQVYVISNSVLKAAMELSPDSVDGLQCRIWKEIALRIAFHLLSTNQAYQDQTPEELKYLLERSFVPNLKDFKIFVVTDVIELIVLINGVVVDYNTRDTFVAPCCISRTVQRLILPKSSMTDMYFDLDVFLLVVPVKETNQYDVMSLADKVCEFVDNGSATRCLQHTVRRKSSGRKSRVRNFLQRRSIYQRDVSAVSSRMSATDKMSTTSTTESRNFYFKNKSETQSLQIPCEDQEEEEISHSIYSRTMANRKT